MTAGTPRVGRTWSLHHRVAVAFSGLAALLVVLSAVIVISLVQFVRSGNEVIYHWEPAVTGSQNVFTDLLTQESNVRGYALTGSGTSLGLYTQYLAAQQTGTAALRGYLTGHPALLRQLTEVTAAATAWRTGYAQPLIAGVQAHDPAAITAETASAAHDFDLVRSRATTLQDGVVAGFRRARTQRRDAIVSLQVALIAAAVLIAAAAVTLLRGLRRWVLRPVDRLAEQTQLVTDGDIHRQIAPGGPPELYALGTGVETMRRRITDELARIEAAQQEVLLRSAELARSNGDLEQFAYVASHDLSEPLRKVANFCQLLEMQYADQLDDKARLYIGFAVDGAKRMQQLINDLLAFSRVGRSTDEFVPVSLGSALNSALGNLDSAVTESGAVVEHGPLPTVSGDQALLVALLQNLVGNAIKYRGEQPPAVRIEAEPLDGGGWQLSVADNGIGIDARYGERIFAIFQRLHVRDEYPGTGIGLALCRRIVEFHRGRIWLDSDGARAGATFRFTLAEGPSIVP